MSEIFITVLNMSLTASYVAAAVILARLLLKRAPKIFSYALWAVVLFRMICPFSFESVLSLLPTNPEPIPQDIVYTQTPAIDSGIAFVDNAVNNTIQAAVPIIQPETSIINPMQVAVAVGTCIWLLGIIVILGYAVISYIRIKRRIFAATLVRDNIFQTDRIQTPFVIGFVRPKIYIPVGLAEKETDYIIMHERTHIKRGDHLVKVLAFAALAVHWFNPLMWLGYFLMSKDMEMSCDERVMKLSGEDIRAKYSQSLLSLSVKQSGLPSPLAFGESNVKARIKNVLNFKKHPRLIIALAAILALTVIVGCAMNRVDSGNPVEDDGFIEKDIEIGGYTISMELPKNMAGRDYMTGSGELFYYNIQEENTVPIANDTAIVIGSVSLGELGNIPEEQFEYFKENPEQNYRAVYSYLPMGSMITRGIDYKTVYESEDQREGTATDLIYYRSDYLENIDYNMDFSHFKEEITESDPRISYYNKGVLGYNLDSGKFVKIELYYDAVTDEEWQHIAETLRITGKKAVENAETAESTTSVVPDDSVENITDDSDDNQSQNFWEINGADFFVMTYLSYFDGAPYGCDYGRNTGRQMTEAEMLADLENHTGFSFDSETTKDRYIRFDFNPKKDPAEILGVYYLIGNNESDKHTLDYPMKVPEEIGVYNFFVNLKWEDDSEETVYFKVEVKAPVLAEPAPAPRPAGLEEEVYRFIPWHHYYNTVLDNDELKPQVDTFYAIYETYLLETAIGTKFDGDVEAWLIPVETVKNAVSYLYDLDGNSVQYDEIHIDKDNPDYFRYPVGGPSPVWAFIQWDTLTVNNSVFNFDVIFYDSPTDDSDRGEELRTFNYQFEQKLYKDSSPSKTVCYKFIGATRVK